ncbi:MAG: serine hydrolase domain-containing protein, partial [Acidobacteriota bacterium]|nr:serine hydrolase domain-containing protein [Acidobacteriota bacterium]
RIAEEQGFSGVVLIARGPEILLNEGYGLADDRGTPMTRETIVLTGSISKQFTAAAVLLLEQRGLLDTGDSVGAFLDDAPPDKAAITIHELLTHTAGFTRDHFTHDLTPMSYEEGRQAIYDLPLGYEPGTDFAYSNTGYAVLAMIVQEVAGRPFLSFVREDVFRPFGLTSTGFFPDDWSGHAVATAYFNGESQGPPSMFPGPFWGNMGNAGVMSTTADLFRWLSALRAGEVFEPERTERLFRPVAEWRPGVRYGYGWITRDSTPLGPEIGHGGVGLGGNSELAYYLDHDLTIVVLSNRVGLRFEDGRVIQAGLPAREARDQLLRNLVSGDFSTLPPQTPVTNPPSATRVTLMVLGVIVIGAIFRWRRRLREID